VLGDVIGGRYTVDEVIGTGGMSTVYKARDRQLERVVALKVLHPHFGEDTEHVARFRHEARAVAQLSHPNVVTVIDRGQSDGRQFIVFEYVEGESLKQLVGRRGPLPVREAVGLAVQVADGLAFAHAHGIVHRDVKPQNVLVDGEGRAMVTDFGIARSLDAERGVTLAGTVLGTSSYFSPEQASGSEVTTATDVYSLGVVLFELLTGDVPFAGDNPVALAMQHLNDAPPSLRERRPDVPLRLAAAIDRALAKRPADRFESMDAFAAELRRSVGETGGRDEPTMVVRRPPKKQRRRLPVALALLGLLAAIAAGSVYLIGGSKTPPATPVAGTVDLRGITAYDPPPGDGHEHNAEAHLATDRHQATFWATETYFSPTFGGLKDGVGLVLDAGGPIALHSLTVSTDTPGYTAIVRAGDSPGGPFADDSPSLTVAARTTFTLDGHTARYYVLWITNLGTDDTVHVNEVTAS
jgi:serine/threonine-protein kinase